ncbi:MAG TPA: MFS transporter, partial [Solirubrobacteraceae bacterium]|nr:MFS transporter [Solirubrobacteraceae bacterium]
MSSPSERQHYGITLAVLALAGLAYALLQSLVAPALPEIQHSLHASESGVTWVLTSYLLSASVATPLLGRLGDIHGKERVLIGVLVALAIGTVVSALATSLPVMVAGRVVQGAGGGIFPLAFAIIRDEFPRERVAGGIGLISAILGIGAGAGIVLAGVIVDNLSYHWLFWFPLVAVVVAIVATAMFVPESPIKAPARISWGAAALLSAGLAAVLLAVSQAATWGWASARTLGLIAAGL